MANYEALRRTALGQRSPHEGPSLGLAILRRQGVAAWLRAWVLCPRPAEPATVRTPSLEIPTVIHTELAQLWAHIALSHQEAAWI